MDNLSIGSGVSSVVMNIYRNIDKEKIQFDFLVSNKTKNSYADEIKNLGGEVFFSYNPLSLRTIISACNYNKKFFEKYAKKYVAVHLHSPTICEMTIKYASQFGVRNIIVHSHSSIFSTNKIKQLISKILIRNIKKYGNIFVACSSNAAQFLYGKQFCKSHEIKIIYNGIDCKANRFAFDLRRAKRSYYNLTNKTVVLHVSNFSKLKNAFFLISLVKDIIKEQHEIYFIFVGDGPETAQIEKYVRDNKIEKYCKFVGFSTKINEYVNIADIFALPSLKEGLPVSVIEAQAGGLPCIVSDTVTQEVDLGGVKYLNLNKKKWISYISNFHPKNNDERKKISDKVRDSLFNIERSIKFVENFYLSLH